MATASTVEHPSTSRLDPWWKGAVIYQIYPRSFADSNGDGIGDLPGITAHLDHVAALGVDAIWVSPFFTSPMRDFGYDVADFCGVDRVFGTIVDFDALVERAHALGLKVLIDQVYSHSSDKHPWFVESRSCRDNPRADWYVWANARPDGSPPNNWQSVFGGPAWTWDARRGQYYLHNFLAEQPDLNLHNPDVQDAMIAVARFWVERGVDGFRLDALNFAMHDPQLRDNPPAPDDGRVRTRPFDFQLKRYNQSHPDIVRFIERLRAELDRLGGAFTMAEVGGDNAIEEMRLFTAGNNRLDSAYGFDFLYAPALTPKLVERALSDWPEGAAVGWPSWAFENHDAPRGISRWADRAHAAGFARMKALLLMALRGNAILYQGEELGLTQVDIPFEALQDPEAIANWPLTLSRDGARTPMPWVADAPDRAFGSAHPWLPHGPDHAALAVDRQTTDPASLLHWTQRLVALRHKHPELSQGSVRIIEATDALLVFERSHGNKPPLVCAFNLSAVPVEWDAGSGLTPIIGTGDWDADTLGPYAAFIARRLPKGAATCDIG